MISQVITQYDSPHQFEPLMPAEPFLAPLLEKAGDLTRQATALGSGWKTSWAVSCSTGWGDASR